MNIQDIPGKPWPAFLRDRGFALFDALVAAAVLAVLFYVYRKISKATFLVRYSLRKRLFVAVAILATLVGIGIALHADPFVLLGFSFIGFGLLVTWVLKDISKVGITNAFETTAQGVSALASLKEVKRELVFLGIGARKLTETSEFDAMLSRCKAAGGTLKFLLSSPENTALENIAKLNGRNDLSYRSRVKESIREIFTRAEVSGVDFEVRLYDLKQKISLPHFRLMFIDDKLCVFSQLVWNTAEGLDNPQLILKRNASSAGSSLYQGYREYYDDLWNLDTTVQVTASMLASWPA